MDQERYVAPRLLRHRQPETEDDARCDPDALGQLLLSTAGGDFDADSPVPRIEREATGEKNDPFSISGDFVHRHHVAPLGQLYVPRESSFPIPLKYIEVNRQRKTNLGSLQESNIDDYWNCDGNSTLWEDWIGFTRIQVQKKHPPQVGKRKLDQRPANIQARFKMSRIVDHYVLEGNDGSQATLGRRRTRQRCLTFTLRHLRHSLEDEDHEDIRAKRR